MWEVMSEYGFLEVMRSTVPHASNHYPTTIKSVASVSSIKISVRTGLGGRDVWGPEGNEKFRDSISWH